ncbi:MAG: InlB B-repeat-containing protein [Clostridia bacterium]|nr:InlB B-repeat-containing protein [Clostridia bacterium]
MSVTKRVLAILMIVAMLIPTIPSIITAADTATVFFNANGGTGGPGKVTATVGSTLTVPSTNPSKSGMVFRGWAITAENAALGNITYTAGSSVNVKGDLTLYASYAYTVVLKCGAEGAGTSSKTLYKFPGKELALYHDKSSIRSNYGMYPKNNDQRSFIEWNTKQDSTTSKGIGTAYYYGYTTNASATLYAIWGYPIQYNADGGIFPLTGDSIFLKYVCGYDDNNYQNPKTLYGNFDLPEGDNTPVKEGCRLYTMSDGRVFYGLLNADLTFFTTETAQQNLTIPPTGGKLPWSVFHTVTTENGTTAVEFPAIWEPSVTYKANSGSGADVIDWITWDWDGLHMYNNYYVLSNTFSKSGASFKSWNTKADGSGTTYYPGSVIDHNSSDPIVLYAQWSNGAHGEQVPEKHTVHFDANGGTNAPANQTKYSDSTLTISTQKPIRPGYKFAGWTTSKSSTTVSYSAGSSYKNDADLRLYAVWSTCTSHSYVKTASSASTCTTQGKITYTCSTCKQAYDEYQDYSHTWGSWVPSSNNTEVRTCSVCGATETREASCIHVYDAGWVTKEATCNAYGVIVYTCTLCGAMYNEKLPMLDHSFTNYVSNNNATCNRGSTFTALCDYGCGTPDTYIDDSTKLDHVFTNYIPDDNATCMNGGTATASCDNGCGATDTKDYDGAAIGHKFSYYSYNNDATCGKNGTMTAVCAYGCGTIDTKEKPNSATGEHVFYDYISNNDATCTADGTMTAYCENGCDVTDTIKDMGTKLDHIFTTYTDDNNPTCTTDATRTACCEYGCGTTDSQYIDGTKIDHVFTVYTKDGNATCQKDGTKTAKCDFNCGTTDTVADENSTVDHWYTDFEYNRDATCTENGTETSYCNFGCGESVTVEAEDTAKGHVFGEWTETKEPTSDTYGEETRYCSVCGDSEMRYTPMIGTPEITVDNYDVSITNADKISFIRYASGVHTTASSIKNAEDCVNIDASVIKANTTDGVYNRHMPTAGYYTFWIKMVDGKQHIIEADVTNIKASVSSYGVKVTIHDIYDIKDAFIAKGEYNSYNELKNDYIVRLTNNKIAGKHDYTYTVTDPGMHTVLVRYNDGSELIFHEELVVDVPTFYENGLQVTVGNIPDVRIIRTATGQFTTSAEIKRAADCRNFNNKNTIKNAESYMIQYRTEGWISIVVEYNNGYQHVHQYYVQPKTPDFAVDGTTVTIGNLDDLYIVRYAVGTYTSGSEIKNAEGSEYIRPAAVVNGIITVELDYGTTYTFLVQYNDESYNYFTFTTEEARPEGMYIMTMDPNGGTMPEGYELKYYFYLNQRFQDVIGGYPVPTRPGYTFYAWERVDYPHDHTWEGGWGTQPYTFDHDVTLRALWIKN